MKVFYFAWVKARTGMGSEEIELPPDVKDLGGLVDWLAQRSPGHAAAFADRETVKAAVNHEYAELDHPIVPTDEVAFFPPVTGG